jgi:hypothetical protein
MYLVSIFISAVRMEAIGVEIPILVTLYAGTFLFEIMFSWTMVISKFLWINQCMEMTMKLELQSRMF